MVNRKHHKPTGSCLNIKCEISPLLPGELGAPELPSFVLGDPDVAGREKRMASKGKDAKKAGVPSKARDDRKLELTRCGRATLRSGYC